LNVNGLNTPIKRQRVAEWKKNRSQVKPQNNSQQIQKDPSHTTHLFLPKIYETGNQPQEKKWKEHKYMEINDMLLNNE